MPLEITPNLAMPYIMPSQAQKHVTHNEAIRALDVVIQLSVLDRDLNTPPASPINGARYLVPAGATGQWLGQSGMVASFCDSTWFFYTPIEGWVIWIADEDVLLVYSGTAWVSAIALNPAQFIGINTVADATNRLAVKSDAVLLSHDDVTPGSGNIRTVLNKLNTTKTASFLFQNNYSARAEFGLIGNDSFQFKISPNGTTWVDAQTIAANGETTLKPVLDVPLSTLTSVLNYRVNGTARWAVGTQTAETGANAGSNFHIHSYSDTGAYLNTSFAIIRSTGAVQMPGANFANAGISFSKDLRPSIDNAFSVGTSALRFSVIYAATGTINTSDVRQKTDIEECPLGLDFIKYLSPKLYRWREGGNDVAINDQEVGSETQTSQASPRPGRRQHTGFIAQDVKIALDKAGVDCGMWVLDDLANENSTQSLRYDQIIAPLVRAVQELAGRLEAIESEPRMT